MTKRKGILAAGVVAVMGVAGALTAQAAEPGAAQPAAPATQPAPAMHHHHGMHGAKHVERVQQALNGNGAQLSVDGKWGPKTEAALKQFQQQHGLQPTGHLDHATREQLKV